MPFKIAMTLWVCCLAWLCAPAQLRQDQLTAPVSLTSKTLTLDEVFISLKQQTGYDFFYDREAARKVTVQTGGYSKTTLGKVLNGLQKTHALEYAIRQREISVRIGIPQKEGHIGGRVMNDKGEVLPGATIRIPTIAAAVLSDASGAYQLPVPAGNYTIEVSYISFQSQRINNVQVGSGQTTPLDIALKPSKNQLNEVLVTADYRKASIEGLYARQKNNVAVSDGITAEQINRTPDNNAAQVLSRVSGLQVSQDRFVVVRGMSDRYNNVLLNNAPLPSTEPNRRDFAFDVIPSSLVDAIVVNKTATPDMTGEFTGGLVQITTKDIPDENYMQLSAGVGYNSLATGKEFIGGYRGTANYLGFANDRQRAPKGMTLAEYNDLGVRIQGRFATPDQMAKAAKYLSRMPDNWALKRYTGSPSQQYQFTLGRNGRLANQARWGLVAALTYRNEQSANQHDAYETGVRDYKGKDYIFNTLWGASVNLGYSKGRSKFTLKNTYNQRFSDAYYVYAGLNGENTSIVSDYSAQTVINSLFQTNFTGEHVLGKSRIKADYGFAFAATHRNQPFTRLMDRYHPAGDHPDDYYTYNFSDANIKLGSAYFSDLQERRYTWQLNVQAPFRLLGADQSLKIGYQGSSRQGDFGASYYRLHTVDPNKRPSFDGQPYYDVYNATNFANGTLYYTPTIAGGTSITNSAAGTGYKGRQQLNAYYAMLDMKLLKHLRITGGVRAEDNLQRVATITKGKAGPNEVAPYVDSLLRVQKNDLLPSVNLTYALTPRMNLRAAWYKTLARPDFRELSFFNYFDYNLFVTVSGNNLKPTSVENYDLRYEFYPSPGEIISVSAFRKKFTNPIEVVVSTSATRFYYYVNLASAENTGFELDARKSLGFFNNNAGFWSKLYASGNFTWVDASVNLGTVLATDPDGKPISAKRNRPLTGQSPYIINGGLLYAGNRVGVNVTYNRHGARIVYASPNRAEDLYENARNDMDLQLSYKFGRQQRMMFKLNVNNLLNNELFYYRNLFPKGSTLYPEQTPSVETYPGDGTPPFPKDQLDPKGTRYNAKYDTKIFTWKYGTTTTLNFIYQF